MTDAFSCKPGDWVEVEYVLLDPSERAAGLPADTASQPLRAWLKGFALAGGMIGDEVEVETMSGRIVRGHLSAVSPGYSHTFGTPPPEIVGIGRDARARVAAYRAKSAAAAEEPDAARPDSGQGASGAEGSDRPDGCGPEAGE